MFFFQIYLQFYSYNMNFLTIKMLLQHFYFNNEIRVAKQFNCKKTAKFHCEKIHCKKI